MNTLAIEEGCPTFSVVDVLSFNIFTVF
jgi:hypothetical protein